MSNSVYSLDMSHHKGVTCVSLGSERARFGALSFKALSKKRREGAPAQRRYGCGVAGELSGHRHRGREIQARAPLGEFPGGPVIRLHTSTAGDTDSIPGQETKIPAYHDVQLKKKKLISFLGVLQGNTPLF